MQSDDQDITTEDEWKYIALIIDSFLMYTYCTTAIIGTFYFFWTIGTYESTLANSESYIQTMLR